jgi:hypothetical protein
MINNKTFGREKIEYKNYLNILQYCLDKNMDIYQYASDLVRSDNKFRIFE